MPQEQLRSQRVQTASRSLALAGLARRQSPATASTAAATATTPAAAAIGTRRAFANLFAIARARRRHRGGVKTFIIAGGVRARLNDSALNRSRLRTALTATAIATATTTALTTAFAAALSAAH